MITRKRCHRLRSLSVVGGFLDGLHIEFAEGLNCLIGPRGTGKTTVLEFIRYALNAFPQDATGQASRKRVEALVRSNLGDGRIRLALQTKDGLEYVVDRTTSGDPLVLDSEGQPTDVRITSGVFVADIFSQNEVESIADCPQSQLDLIDRFAAVDLDAIRQQIASVRSRLEANANAQIPLMVRLKGLQDDLTNRDAIAAKIKVLAADQGDPKTDEVNIAHRHRGLREREAQAVQGALEQTQEYARRLHSNAGQFARRAGVGMDEQMMDGPNADLMSTFSDQIQMLGKQLDALFEQAAETVEQGAEQIRELQSQLLQAHQKQELAYRDLIASDTKARGVATERAELEKRQNELLTKARQASEIQTQLAQLRAERQGFAAELSELADQRFAKRQEIAAWINDGADSPIRVQIDQCGDMSGYRGLLRQWLREFVHNHNVAAEKVARFIPPSILGSMVDRQAADELRDHTELSQAVAEQVIQALDRPEVRLQLDAVEPMDLPRIELLDGSEWKNSLQLSTGQKCTTILPILLLESDNPLLVDQPEDNLDNRYIYDTVVNALHRVKQRRQVILITHNPNIPVLGEASQVYVLSSDGDRSQLAQCGSVDECRLEIVNLLEGGEQAFIRRKDRYAY